MPESEQVPINKIDKGKTKAQSQNSDHLLQRIKDSTITLANGVNNGVHSLNTSALNRLQQITNDKQGAGSSATNDTVRHLLELEQKENTSRHEVRKTCFQLKEASEIERNEHIFRTWRSEENDGAEMLEFLKQQLPSDLSSTQLPEKESSRTWLEDFERTSREVENAWHTPKDDGAEVLHFLHSQEFPSNLVPDLIENREDIHEKWYQEFEKLNFEVSAEAIPENDPLLEQTLHDWGKEFDVDNHRSYIYDDVDAFRNGPTKECEILSSSIESSSLPYTPTHDICYHDSHMDGQEVLEFLNNSLYSDVTLVDFSDPTNFTSRRQSKYQPLCRSTGRKYASDILEYLVCIPYTDEVYGSYDFSWVDTRSNALTGLGEENAPNQHESALQRLKLLKGHLVPKGS